jgi:hypothetical protein
VQVQQWKVCKKNVSDRELKEKGEEKGRMQKGMAIRLRQPASSDD